MTTSLQEIKKEFALKFSNWKIHHKTSPCIKDDYVVTEIADWWLAKLRSREEEIVAWAKEHKKKIGHILKCKMCSPKCGYNSALSDLQAFIQKGEEKI